MRAFIVDAFTDRPFAGNPAGVCMLDAPADPSWMQRVAAELNLSETAFVHPVDQRTYGLRWFTPTVEVSLCGHATLATAHVLYTACGVSPDAAVSFDTLSGVLTARPAGDGRVTLDFPVDPPAEDAVPERLAEALGTEPVWTGRASHDLVVEVRDAATVGGLAPDIAALAEFSGRAVIVTARAREGADHDFVSRVFAPAAGIPEDPVTGAAHCVLAPYWAGRLGRTELTARQLSPRGGQLGVALRGERVALVGRAVTVFEGELRA
ncbi:PhzF family phenazine biosynthesis protein [Streptomyces sp. PTM05]|uniref:PhzF family phenazine biosynthesis protein n=1 Tax=Streptantibioticus parmotrematis TaxID=2873249 RepID=A0ABS7R293_9ACTN|nr:PhzF family phenazine biosynthesis protein [Streptantibioticus parmotrematis]MBY8889066.1 PhzF family phenazine biosynthesis protein [Streptantibioticus parmotrematis]